MMEELGKNALPSSSELAVQIVNGSFAWDSSFSADKTIYIDRLRSAACKRKTTAKYRSDAEADCYGSDCDDDADVRPDPAELLYEAIVARDDDPDVLFDINFTVAKVSTSLTVLVLMMMMMMMMRI